jgi:hypothetical protein
MRLAPPFSWLQSPESDYLDAALITVMQIHLSEPEGRLLQHTWSTLVNDSFGSSGLVAVIRWVMVSPLL